MHTYCFECTTSKLRRGTPRRIFLVCAIVASCSLFSRSLNRISDGKQKPGCGSPPCRPGHTKQNGIKRSCGPWTGWILENPSWFTTSKFRRGTPNAYV